MPRVVHFEIHSAAPEAAAKFYSEIFGWKITKWEGPMDYWLVSTGESGPGIDGGIVARQGGAPAPGSATNAYVCTIGVESLDQTIAAVLAQGGKIAFDKHELPGIGFLAYFTDLDRNTFGALQPL
ncbi:MAG TPA: VOC family protein [Candidatus Cybelea sp.]|jgi:hypothetical protein